MRAAILVDEMNAVSQLHDMNIEGIKPWKAFYESIHAVLVHDYGICDVSYHMYGAVPPAYMDKERHVIRNRFFNAVEADGISTHKGFVFSSGKGFQEKGVDMLLGLDIYQFSLDGYDLIFLFSGDSDLVPAVQRAQRNGTKVVSILSQQQPAKLMKKYADGVIPLEAIIDLIDEEHILRHSNKSITF